MNSKTEPEAPEPNEAQLPDAEVVDETEGEDVLDLSPEELVQRERDEFYENWRRTQADFQNHRRRQAQVIEASVKAARRELFGELLLVLDYLDMALLSPVETPEGKNLLMGVQMTRNQMMQFLQKYEVELIESEGLFDPARHEAIERILDSEHPAGTIVQTVRRGYMAGADVLRHAHVKVAFDAEPSAADDTQGAETADDPDARE